MRTILGLISFVFLLCTSCDRDPTLPPTTPERPPQLRYGWALIEGAIIIREEGFIGEFAVTCGSNLVKAYSNKGSYSLMLRLEREASAGATETCRVDVGQPIIVSRTMDVPVATRPDSAGLTRFDVVLLPDAPPVAQMEKPIVSVAAAGGHTCALSATGAAYCWGTNVYAELGFGWHLPTLYAARAVTSERFVSVATSGYVRSWVGEDYTESSGSCALRSDGAVFCWGESMRATMGSDVSAKDVQVPQRAINLPLMVALSGGATKVCGITQLSELYCWGGYAWWTGSNGAELQRIDISNVTDVDDGELHSCALIQTGKWHCRGGANEWGEYGDTTPSSTFTRIAVGKQFTCALDQEGLVWCWGRNDVGQLGRGTIEPGCPAWEEYKHMCPGTDVSPQRVATDVHFTEIDAGRNHACGLAQDGTVYCWGAAPMVNSATGLSQTARRRLPRSALPTSASANCQ